MPPQVSNGADVVMISKDFLLGCMSEVIRVKLQRKVHGLSLCCREARVGRIVPVLQGGEGGSSLCCRVARVGCPCVAGR